VLYAKWQTQTDNVSWAGFTGLTPAIKNGETGKICTAQVDRDKLEQYKKDGYYAVITFYYTAGVPSEYEGTADASVLRIQLGLSTDETDATFTTKAERIYDPMPAGQSQNGSIAMSVSLDKLLYNRIAVRLTIRTNDTSVLGICGRDAGTFTNLTMKIEYVK
jgi:hypothetical protein